jgi:hypothetical protein
MPKVTTKSSTNDTADILSVLLSKMSGSHLHTTIRTALQRKQLSGPEIETLLALLAKCGAPVDACRDAVVDTKEHHCVRCHQSYLECNNGHKSCRISHDFTGVNYYHIKGGGLMWTCDRCQKEVFEQYSGNSPDDRTCEVGSHTTDELDLDYAAENYGEEGCCSVVDDEDDEDDEDNE